MKQTLNLKQQQKLKLTPELQQAIRLLQLSSQELDLEVRAVLESNPLLEYDNTDDLNHIAQNDHIMQNADFTQSADFTQNDHFIQNDIVNFTAPLQNYAGPEYEYERKSEEDTLKQHLLWQINFGSFSMQERLIANILIDAISDDGYLCCSLEEMCDTLKAQESREFAMADIEAVLFKIQQFEPLGVAARDLRECLGIQLNNLSPKTPGLFEAKKLVQDFLPLLGAKNYKALSSELKLPQTHLKSVIRLITKLDPRPGQRLNVIKRSECIIPDLILRKKNGSFVVELNMDVMPKIRINSDYSILLNVDTQPKMLYLRRHLKEAQWFLKGLKSRYSTLLKVANCIVQQQNAFLEKGEEFMQGLSLQTVAKITHLHESTISRVTTHKYLETHRGTFELKHFFSAQIQTEKGDTHATTAVRAVIKKIIQEECRLNPFSDEQIREILLSKNMPLSRRTISKYRESMHILSSKKRHQAQ